MIRQALEHRRGHDWDQAVPTRMLRGAKLAHAAALFASWSVSAVLVVGSFISRSAAERPVGLEADAALVQIEPGDTRARTGNFAARRRSIPGKRSLGFEPGRAGGIGLGGSPPHDPQPGRSGVSRVASKSVDADLSYRVEFGDRRSRTFHVRVFEYPELDRADAKLVFPRFTSLAPKTVEDIRHITAVEGTEVSLLCRLNKDVASAKLVDEQGQELVLTRQKDGNHVYQATLTLTDPKRYRVQLVNDEGRSNKLTAEIVANVTRNRLPVVTMSQPAHDVRVSPIEELKLKAQMDDDFGLVRHGITYTLAGGEPREIELPRAPASSRRYSAEHLLDFESLRTRPTSS